MSHNLRQRHTRSVKETTPTNESGCPLSGGEHKKRTRDWAAWAGGKESELGANPGDLTREQTNRGVKSKLTEQEGEEPIIQ